MNPEQIAELLQKAVSSALNKTVTGNEKPEQGNHNDSEALANLAKAVTGINDRLDNLDKVAVKQEPETVETQVQKLGKTVENLAGMVSKIAKGEKIEPKDEPMDFSKMTKEQFNELVTECAKGLIKNKTQDSPGGEGKEDLASVLKSLASGKSEDDVELEMDEIETEDVAGNKLSKKARASRQQLDNWFGKKFGASVEKHMGAADDNDDDDDDDNNDDDDDE